MVEVETFLRLGDGSFVPITDCDDSPDDSDYIEGAIALSIDGYPVIGVQEWDYVDQLWTYVSEMVRVMLQVGVSSIYFPDQPIKLEFKRQGNRVLISREIGSSLKKFSVPEADLLNELRSAGKIFFERMSKLLPENADTYRIALRDLFSG